MLCRKVWSIISSRLHKDIQNVVYNRIISGVSTSSSQCYDSGIDVVAGNQRSGNNNVGLVDNKNDDNKSVESLTTRNETEKKRIQRHNSTKRSLLDPLAPPLPPSAFSSYSGQEHFKFRVIHQSRKSAARVCQIETSHGIIDTPGYVPVATNAALKALEVPAVDDFVQLMFANTYHLMLHPGGEVIADAGGLHSFMSRSKNRPIITDSGGFQVFSLAYGTVHSELHSLKRSSQQGEGVKGHRRGNLVVSIREEGVTFCSYRDGTKMLLSPESSVQTQKQLGGDIILPLDELPPYHISEDALAQSVARSHRWEARSLAQHIKDQRFQAMYGIIHGGSSLGLRQRSAEYISSLPFDGFALGGALGKDSDELFDIVRRTVPFLNASTTAHEKRPIHVLGIADPVNVRRLVPLGCDTFDSCHATRIGRHGTMMLPEGGTLRVAAGQNKSAHRSPVEGCQCHTCMTYSLSYLHHLVKANEPVAATLLSLHNVYCMTEIMRHLRHAILRDEI